MSSFMSVEPQNASLEGIDVGRKQWCQNLDIVKETHIDSWHQQEETGVDKLAEFGF